MVHEYKVVTVKSEEIWDLGKDGRILLNVIWKKQDVNLGIWLYWLRMWFIRMILWLHVMYKYIFNFIVLYLQTKTVEKVLRPPNAFMAFCRERCHVVASQNPKDNKMDISKG
jgi:hypothetical protein